MRAKRDLQKSRSAEEDEEFERWKSSLQNDELKSEREELRRVESRLCELSELAYPNDEEQLEEFVLKKKKIRLEDQMYSVLMQYMKNKNLSH